MSSKIIVLTGPESSGKTTLALDLANHWNSPLVKEVARDYLKGRTFYQEQDLTKIAMEQNKLEQKLLNTLPRELVCDTDLLVIMIWSEVKYGRCDPWIYTTFEKIIESDKSQRFYCLCDYNIPWEEDELRENSHNRDELFELYLDKLNKYSLDFCIVKGGPIERLEQVLNLLK